MTNNTGAWYLTMMRQAKTSAVANALAESYLTWLDEMPVYRVPVQLECRAFDHLLTLERMGR